MDALSIDITTTTTSEKGIKGIFKYFSRAGSGVVSHDVGTSIKRTNGISYREFLLTFADSQTVMFRVKNTGDVYQVLLNKKIIPIKNQDKYIEAIGEIVGKLNVGRTKFQAKLAKALVKLPATIRTAAPKMLVVLTEKRDSLVSAIADVRSEIEAVKAG